MIEKWTKMLNAGNGTEAVKATRNCKVWENMIANVTQSTS